MSPNLKRAVPFLLILSLALSFHPVAFAGEPRQTGLAATPLTPVSSFDAGASKGSASLASVVVKLEDDSLAAYRGGVAGLAATNLAATGAPRLDTSSPASQAYLAYLTQKQGAFEAALLQAVPAARITHRYKVVFGGVSVLAPGGQLGAIARLPGVKAVYPDRLEQVVTERSPQFVGAPVLWDALGGQDDAGEGIVLGAVDTGIWPEHASFSDPDPNGEAYAAPPPTWTGTACDFGNVAWNPNDAPFTCQNKLIGAAEFLDTYKAVIGLLPDEFDSARDSAGHGTHTTSTAGGNGGVAADIFDIPRGTISGIAPRAHVAMYRACAHLGCFSSDTSAAIDQAVADGVDSLNYSISGGENPYTDVVSLAFLDAFNAGVFVAASAGNSGPGADTVAHREPWTATVGASTSDRHFLSDLTLTADNGDTLELTGASVTDGIAAPTGVVLAADSGDALCLDPFPAGTWTGQIVVCERGINARVEKSFNVAEGGAGGMVLYNPVLQGLATDNHFIPSIHLEFDDGTALLDFMAAHTGEMGTFTAGTASTVLGDVMASFSSRGGPGQSLGVSKPDLTAPGVQILAGHSPLPHSVEGGLPGELFQAIAGTSMSSPHVAGSGALLAHLHPDWGPGQIKSALMTTAKTKDVFKEDGLTPADPFDDGSGRIDLRNAGDPGLTFDETGANYLALEDSLWDANYPSLYVPVMPGEITVQRTAHSVLGGDSQWQLSVASPPDVIVTVPATIDIPAGGDTTFEITVNASGVPLGEVRHATLRLNHGSRRAHLPITIVRGEPSVTLDKTCDPATFPLGSTTECTVTIQNNGLEDTTVSFTDRLPKPLKLLPGSVVGGTPMGNGVVFDGMLFGAGSPIITVDPGSSPFGYFPMSSLGVPPIAGMGDETGVNLTGFDPFLYAGEMYDIVFMTSNGYGKAGEGTGDDIQFVNQALPDAALPNNTLAPFWSDLDDTEGAGAMRAAVVTADFVSFWLVLDWEDFEEFGGGSPSDFQIWLGLNGVEDISYTYGPDVGDGTGSTLTVGAEDKDGISGDNEYVDLSLDDVANGTGTLPSTGVDLVVTTVPGTPGETHVITFSARGRRVGAWTNCARMTGDTFFGTNIACFSGEVTP